MAPIQRRLLPCAARRSNMITVEHLTKCYGDFLAVDDLSFEIDEGHV